MAKMQLFKDGHKAVVMQNVGLSCENVLMIRWWLIDLVSEFSVREHAWGKQRPDVQRNANPRRDDLHPN